MKKYTITTVSELRTEFWNTFTEFKSEYRKSKKQNDYNTDIRCTWVDFVDAMQKDGVISEKLANRATL
jgi:hypothetical protein